MLLNDEKKWINGLSKSEVKAFTMLDIVNLPDLSAAGKKILLQKRSKIDDQEGKLCTGYLDRY